MESLIQHLHTNYVPTEPEIDLIHAHLAPYEAESARLESLIRDLSAQRDRVKAYVDPYRALASQGRRIPQELLEKIFLDCLPEHRNVAMSPTEAPLLLGHVCSEWRSIAFALPELWASLHVSSDFLSSSTLPELRAWLPRSASCPLTLSLQCGGGWNERKMLAVLNSASERWKTLQIGRITAKDFISDMGSTTAPFLRDIEVNLCKDDSRWWEDDAGTQLSRFLASPIFKGSHLRTIIISAPSPGALVTPEPSEWDHLLNLTLAIPDHNALPFNPSRTTEIFTVNAALRLLGACPRLLSVRVQLLTNNQPSYPETIVLPQLESLVILDDSIVAAPLLSYLLDHLNLPTLVDLHLLYQRNQRFTGFPISGPQYSLPAYFTKESLTEIFHGFPSLVTLRSTPESAFASINTLHILRLLSETIHCPELAELILEDEIQKGKDFCTALRDALLHRRAFRRVDIQHLDPAFGSQLALEEIRARGVEVLSDPSTLLALRSANKAFHQLATPKAFREVVVTQAAGSAEWLTELQSSASVVGCVQSAVFRDSSEDNEDALTDVDPRLTAVPKALEKLSKFPYLTSLKIEFSLSVGDTDWEVEDEPTFWLRVQRAILQAVSTTPLPTLKSLAIANLITMPSPVLTCEKFAALLRDVAVLSIDTLGPDDLSEGYYAKEGLSEFWEQMTAVLAAAQSVTTLHLRSDNLIGVKPALAFPSEPFVNLTSLHLKHICWDDGVEGFLLAHPALRCLALEDCCMYGYEKQYPRPWGAVIASLDEGLQQLVELDITGKTMLYCYEDEGWGFITMGAAAMGIYEGEDLQALEKWRGNVEARKLQGL
ncbi:hypothetical protein FB45DRAFT_1057050 [Roridomyces roridus]|uniref:F-box domain-containing protein n=1 Tax=Roridomyces roridus TaxID=1738132 RepID=A0AAD7BZX9_9AGAR|nr:hypothetical protein FB45DRAFT_1057050 [Roridomyces roridus]